MELHYSTLGLVLWTVSIIATAVLVIVWRINRNERGPALWAASCLFMAFSFIPLWFKEDLVSGLLLVNNIASALAVLLLLEGVLRFKGLGNEHRRLPWHGAYMAVLASLIYLAIAIENHQLRYLILDANIAAILILTAFFLAWRSTGLERLLYSCTAAAFVFLAAAVLYRWGQAATGVITPDDRVNEASQLIIFASIPWMLAWTYGLTIAANLRAQRTIEHMAQHDPLTGLANRRFLSATMERMTLRCKRSTEAQQHGFGVVALDVNGFKEINDKYGHAFGDTALTTLAQLLVNALRPEDEVVRLGGDEFILLLRGVSDRADLDRLCGRVLEVLATPTPIKGCMARFSVSMGSSLCPHDGTNAEQLIALADQRMYASKTDKQADSAVWSAVPTEC
ncbi:GGDEF domain-containing protein [Halorhodospira halochloris]|uniref:GGDEF domain-containing protein n=1 Tax=Halorhodospira halochloris TaxID=1052 RepID=UPI001EE7F4A3|nr:GGDEF domain-containing protein [Halorhodospira halochloris]MCG5530335.1 GGDEF domain-containing protein [Halorhodospira halochloris]MCG5547927.1 GGDEF domain-containing protein [Halorhodospira halochloris]